MLALNALAAEPPFSRVALLLPNCDQPGLSSSELREAVALDLRDESLTLAPAGELSSATDVLVRIEAACLAESELTLQAEFGVERRTRRVDLREVPPAQRARALSLAVAELLALFGQPPQPPGTIELSQTPAPSVAAGPSTPPVVSTAGSATKPPLVNQPATLPPRPNSQSAEVKDSGARQHTNRLPAAWRLSLAPALRIFDTTWLWGGRALVYYGGWSAGVDLLRAHAKVQAGSVTTLVVHGTFAYAFELLEQGQRSALEAGPRLGLGRAFMTAEAAASARAYDAQDVYCDAAFGVRYSLRFSPVFRVGVGAELGYAAGPVGYADDLEVANTSGTFAALLIDVSAKL